MRKNYTFRTIAILLISILAINVSAQVTDLYGTFTYHNDGIRVLSGVTVLLYDENNNLVATTTTDEEGFYLIPDLPYGTYTITGTYEEAPGGIYVVDALLISDHILGNNSLEEVAFLAADVDGDGEITWDDYSAILFGYLVNGQPFPVGEWRFEALTFELCGMKSSGNSEKGVGGSSTGDVAGAFDPAISHSPIHFFATKHDVYSAPGEELLISIKASEMIDLAAMHLVIDFPSHLVEIIDINTDLTHFGYSIQNDKLILSAAEVNSHSHMYQQGDDLVTLVVRTTQEFSPINAINFTLGDESHFANGKSEHISPKVSLPVVKVEQAKAELLPNYPNPFSLQTNVSYKVAESSQVNISVFGLDGRLLTTIVDEYQNEGTYNIEFRKGTLAPGAYLLRMQTEGAVPTQDTRVMIITSD